MEWKIKERKSNNIIDQLLLNRGICLDQKKAFFDPRLTDLHDPFLLPDMDLAVDLFLNYLKNQSTIGIFADYDADGIPGGVLLTELCQKLGLKTYIYIPSREEGYGLSEKAIDYFISKGVKLLITIDCGISNIKEVDYCRSKNIDVIILDHHEPKKLLPSANAVVDGKRKDSKYPFSQISGAAAGFKFAHAISKKYHGIDDQFLKWKLDLIGISTISDMVPLIDENRVFARWGI